MKQLSSALVLLLSPLWSFACYQPSTSGPAVSVIEEVTTLITTASAALAGPAAMVVTDNGDVLLLDAMLARILVISPDGTIKRTIGSEGAGPSEFRRPRGLAVHADTIRVVDQGNGRMQLFSVAGEHLGSAPIPGGAGGGPLSLRADGWLAVGTRGRDSTLAAYFDETATRRGVLGIPLVPPSALWDFVAIKNQIAQGQVPSVLRNVARPIFANEGGFWLMFAADPLIHRYRSDNELVWAVTVEVPRGSGERRDPLGVDPADTPGAILDAWQLPGESGPRSEDGATRDRGLGGAGLDSSSARREAERASF